MKEAIKKIWNKHIITLDGDEFTIGECTMVWGGFILFVILLNLVA